MDVLVLIDKLDDLVHNAKAVPLTDQVRIDREEIYEILDQMRATIPEEIRQGQWIVPDSKERLAAAERMLEEAREAGASSSLAGAAAEQVRAAAAARGSAADSAAVSSAAIERLRAARQLAYPYAPSVYSAQLDDFYWWVNHADTPIVDAMITINRQMLAPEHDRGP